MRGEPSLHSRALHLGLAKAVPGGPWLRQVFIPPEWNVRNPEIQGQNISGKLIYTAQMFNRAAPTIAAARHDLHPLQALVTSAPYRRRRVSLNF
jgi:hypothetical protein